jgi:hypothetical protein
VCCETGLGRDPYVELSAADQAAVARLGVAEIRRVHPDLWARIGPPSELIDADFESFDLACGRAYTQLAESYRATNQEDVADLIAEGDPGAPRSDWDTALMRVKEQSELHNVGALLLPTDSAARFMALDLAFMPPAEIKRELRRWAREAKDALSGPVPDEAVLEDIHALWLAPEIAIRLDWQAALPTLLAERTVARVTRYVALRSRHAAREEGA